MRAGGWFAKRYQKRTFQRVSIRLRFLTNMWSNWTIKQALVFLPVPKVSFAFLLHLAGAAGVNICLFDKVGCSAELH